MLANHIKVFWRHIRRQPVYAFINISGLAAGMAACMLILLFLGRELSFEEMHPEANRIVRVLTIDSALGTNNQRVGITQPAVGQLGWENPLERRIYQGPQDSTGLQVIGVVQDFNLAGIHQNIEPLIIFPMATNPGPTVVARIQPGRVTDALEAAAAVWASVYPDYPFEYTFLDEEFQQIYERDQTTGRVVNIFATLAILIACLGLFGLASYSTSQRIKEIGVRKVLGASAPSVVKLLVFDFARWVLVANLFAWPLAWYASSRWLEGFAYRVDVDPVLLVMASLVALTISVVTVLSQTLSAARMNPAKALRYE